MWRDLRLATGMSQEELSIRSLCRREDIIDFEKRRKMPCPDQAYQLSNALNKPEATAWYCRHQCAIGQKYCYHTDKRPLTETVVQLQHSYYEAGKYVPILNKIARDALITPDEFDEADMCLLAFMTMERDIEEYKLAMTDARDISNVVAIINREKHDSRRQAEYRV